MFHMECWNPTPRAHSTWRLADGPKITAVFRFKNNDSSRLMKLTVTMIHSNKSPSVFPNRRTSGVFVERKSINALASFGHILVFSSFILLLKC